MMKMKRSKLDFCKSLGRQRSIQILCSVGIIYVIMVSLVVPFVLNNGFSSVTQESFNDVLGRPFMLQSEEDLQEKDAPVRPLTRKVLIQSQFKKYKFLSRLNFGGIVVDTASKDGFSGIRKSAIEAFDLGKKFWVELESGKVQELVKKAAENQNESCPHSISLSGVEFRKMGKLMVIPCGMALGSHITLVGRPKRSQPEQKQKISSSKEEQNVVVSSQFRLELQGLKIVDGEDPPRIFHFNPRLKGDWSGKAVIEQNTCYRMQWGSSLRCEGWKSKADEETVDGQVKCEKWIRDDDSQSEELKTNWWLRRLINRKRKVIVDWPYPFEEEKLFVLTLSAGLEGYHINVDGRHFTSFPYRTGFTLEDATGLSLDGDVDLQSIVAASLPTSHPSFAPQRHLDMSNRWKAPPLPDRPVELFIGVLSAGNHFAERMAVRKSWMQHELVKSSTVVARFFVALSGRKEVNIELKKEAEFFGDIVIVPYMDNYDLVVLKTVAICDYGTHTASAKYVMKCDDDTFVRVDAVVKEAKSVGDDRSLYIGNFNFHIKPFRSGKWAVTYEEWPEEDYPPYANGPGYIVSSDIARYIVSEFEDHKLRLFKMEDVSMGMWIEKFNSSRTVEYIHSLNFCQFGCIEDYYTAHYQSPRQMMCMWDKLQKGKPLCCNMR